MGADVKLAPVVKSEAYGHGLGIAARAFVDGGADWLCVHAPEEAHQLATLGLDRPILILGPVTPAHQAEAVAAGFDITVSELAWLDGLARAASDCGRPARVHLKVETGTHRQGLLPEEFAAARARTEQDPHLELAGVSSHFADVEDTTRHAFAREQLARFSELTADLPDTVVRHLSSSAATILFPDAHFDLVRPGISAYGYWPSRETLASASERGHAGFSLEPALTWKSRITQLKPVRPGDYVGYGRTHRFETEGRLAVVPVGYADGYPRGLGGQAWTLVAGRRCPVRGRVCMNLTMIDVSHVPDADLGSEVVLLGTDGTERIEVETFAGWAGSIHYEVLARLGRHVARMPVSA